MSKYPYDFRRMEECLLCFVRVTDSEPVVLCYLSEFKGKVLKVYLALPYFY